MAGSGHTDLTFNESFFQQVLREPRVEQLVDDVATQAMTTMKATAPVDTGAYRDGFHLEHHESKYRRAARVVNDDEKTMLIESQRGVMARAVKATKK